MLLYDNKELYETLKELDVIKKKDLDEAFEESNEASLELHRILLNKNLISDNNLGQLIADLLNVPFINLGDTHIEEDVLRIIPEAVAKKQKIITFTKDGETLSLAMTNPLNIRAKEFVEKKVGLKVKVYYTTEKDFDNALLLYATDVKKAFEQIINENVREAKGKSRSDPPIIKIVDTVLIYADRNRVSDIHIEPYEDHILVRFRMDGMLKDIVELPRELHDQIVTRIKVMSNLRTDEHQAAQDGKFQFKTEEENLDIRVSVTPITKGEKVVMRLLSQRSRQFDLFGLGLTNENLNKIKLAYKKPYGMILATGPTGCGKTMTMYTILKILNNRNINIMTIEDPVEYDIEGINQIQVNNRTDLTFAKGLRSIVRQDPDVILVGEIRDNETADIAINSAMTGHLVLSTLHTNDAATSMPRFVDMGVEPFLIASSINVIVAQRLVRKICQKCRVSFEEDRSKLRKHLSPLLLKKYFSPKGKIVSYKGKGCPVCHNTGYRGRTGIFEVLLIDDNIKKAIVDRKNAGEITKIAMKNGMVPMIEDGLEKVKKGITTIEEVLRVTKE